MPLIVTTESASETRIQALQHIGAEVLVIKADLDGQVLLPALMKELGARNIQSLLLEAGSVLNGSALRAGIVDRVAFFVAPKILGGDNGRLVFSGDGVPRLQEAVELKDMRWRSFDSDILIEGEVV
jgi:diaminohydroxyphosphoribosylaminopyrimidine deaminase/5-amino-6-(5-phosphoribosylamino)uracil reductase